VVQVLQPLKLRRGHGSQVAQQVWDHYDASLLEDLLSSVGGWAVRSFYDHVAFEVVGILDVDSSLNGTRSEYVVLFREQLLFVFKHFLCSWEVTKSTVLFSVGSQLLRFEAFCIENGTILLTDSDNPRSSFVDVLGKLKAEVAESLDHDLLTK